jgi:glycosyltransferase involved in cell wall biosynthesis
VNEQKTRVLLISHTSQSATEGQPKAHEIAGFDDISLKVLVPDRWMHYGAWREPQAPQNAGFDYHEGRVRWPWGRGAQFYLHYYPELPRLLREFKPDIIDLWEEPWGLVSATTCFWRDKVCPQAKIISETEQNIDKHLPPPFENFRSYVLKRADYTVGRNSESLEILCRKGYRGPSRVVPNGVDTSLFTFKGNTDEKTEFVAGYSGRLVEEKGLDELIDALEFLPSNVVVELVGNGDYEPKLREKAAKYPGRVRFLGAQPLEQLPAIYRGFDCLVLPSRTTARWKEQFGRVLIEAGACGIPVVGSSSGAIPEVIGSGENAMGLVFPECDAKALAGTISKLQNDAALAKRLGENGIYRAKNDFSWACVARHMVEIYRELHAK